MSLEDGDILASVCGHLSVPDILYVGCTCKSLNQATKPIIETRMKQFSEECRVLDEKRKEMERSDQYLNRHEHFTCKEDFEAFVMPYRINRRRRLEHDAVHACLKLKDDDLRRQMLILGSAAQGGPVYITPLHFAAMIGDVTLCRLLLDRGSASDANIFIPNDQDSSDKSVSASNRRDGIDWSQYRWGTITPLRLAMTFGHPRVVELLQSLGASAGWPVTARIVDHPFLFFRALPFLSDSSCWVSECGTQILYQNCYIHGDRIYPDVLFDRTSIFTLEEYAEEIEIGLSDLVL